MSRRKRLPIDMFNDSMVDAQILMMIASAFPNRRERVMRIELRNTVGEALRIKKNDRRKLECIENDKVFLLFKKLCSSH